jgi:hypothetical protein
MIALAIGALLTGCGGGEKSTDTDGKPFDVFASTTVATGQVTKPQFVARANRVCRTGWAKILENFTTYSSWQNPRLSRSALFSKTVRFSFLAGLDFHVFDRIQKLEAPEGEGGDVEEVIGKMQIAVERGQQEWHARSPVQLMARFADYNLAAERYGLGDCLVDGRRLQNAEA